MPKAKKCYARRFDSLTRLSHLAWEADVKKFRLATEILRKISHLAPNRPHAPRTSQTSRTLHLTDLRHLAPHRRRLFFLSARPAKVSHLHEIRLRLASPRILWSLRQNYNAQCPCWLSLEDTWANFMVLGFVLTKKNTNFKSRSKDTPLKLTARQYTLNLPHLQMVLQIVHALYSLSYMSSKLRRQKSY